MLQRMGLLSAQLRLQDSFLQLPMALAEPTRLQFYESEYTQVAFRSHGECIGKYSQPPTDLEQPVRIQYRNLIASISEGSRRAGPVRIQSCSLYDGVPISEGSRRAGPVRIQYRYLHA